jgi:hypothetical protein
VGRYGENVVKLAPSLRRRLGVVVFRQLQFNQANSMNVWWMTINRAMGNSYEKLKTRKVIAQGWPHLGDLSILIQNFDSYWRNHRDEFEVLIQMLALPVYPRDAQHVPRALKNLFNLMSITIGDLIVAVESDRGAGMVMGICEAERNAWESYQQDNPGIYDYAHTVCFPVKWIDWEGVDIPPPKPPAMIAGVQPMGREQALRVEDLWKSDALRRQKA